MYSPYCKGPLCYVQVLSTSTRPLYEVRAREVYRSGHSIANHTTLGSVNGAASFIT